MKIEVEIIETDTGDVAVGIKQFDSAGLPLKEGALCKQRELAYVIKLTEAFKVAVPMIAEWLGGKAGKGQRGPMPDFKPRIVRPFQGPM